MPPRSRAIKQDHENAHREQEADAAQAIAVVAEMLEMLAESATINDLMSTYFDLPCNPDMVAEEFKRIYYTWLDTFER